MANAVKRKTARIIRKNAFRFNQRVKALSRLVQSRYFSILEDSSQGVGYINEIFFAAAKSAVAEAKALGLTRVYYNGKELVQVNSNGEESAFGGKVTGKRLFLKLQSSPKKYACKS